jgi:hypothetical protein
MHALFDDDLLGLRLAVLTATMAMQNSRTPQRAMLRTEMLGTTVSETRIMLDISVSDILHE